jgi:peptidoglycan/LPS O-acetylase OafA/YrhL
MRRIAELDGLRGAAAVLIVAYHLFMDYLPGCWAAVDVFFVLSGYLITTIVLQQDGSWRFLWAFYARRGLRIWPIYYLLILILALGLRGDLTALPYYLTYTQQATHYWGGAMPDWRPMQHTWTLAMEEQFYLFWPALVLLVGRRWTGPLALGVAILAIQARLSGIHWWTLLGRCDGFALGGLLAAILSDPDSDRAQRRVQAWTLVLGALAVLLLAGLAATNRLFGNGGTIATAARATVASLASFTLVASIVRNADHPGLAILKARPLAYLGTISYGIYLYHHPILQILGTMLEQMGIVHVPALWLVEWILTLAVAMASWHWIERPILRLKDRVPYRRGTAPAPIAESPLPVLEPSDAIHTFAS